MGIGQERAIKEKAAQNKTARDPEPAPEETDTPSCYLSEWAYLGSGRQITQLGCGDRVSNIRTELAMTLEMARTMEHARMNVQQLEETATGPCRERQGPAGDG
jgi:NADH:ubiquinone oxidoreductase subunit D